MNCHSLVVAVAAVVVVDDAVDDSVVVVIISVVNMGLCSHTIGEYGIRTSQY